MNIHRDFLTRLFNVAVAAADPEQVLPRHLPRRPAGRTVVIGAGKGAAQLAAAFDAAWEGPLEGVVVTRYGYAVPCPRIKVLEAAHPVPDAAGVAAAQALKDAVTGLTEDDLVVALICGGGSSLLPDPPEGLTLADLQELNSTLLASGAPISVMNAVRKQFSGINGGRLAALAAPARVCTLVVSDVPGDDPGEVASGPTVPGRPTAAAVSQMLKGRGIALPDRCAAYLDAARQAAADTAPAPHPDSETRVIASAAQSLKAAADYAWRRGYTPWILSDRIEGEARDVALVHAALAVQAHEAETPFAPPLLLLSGGETTVTLREPPAPGARGGRNSTFALSLALALDGGPSIYALAADTDGIDGSGDNAGAFVDFSTAADLRAAGHDPQEALRRADAYGAFAAIDALFTPGPTGTNVNDFRAILVT